MIQNHCAAVYFVDIFIESWFWCVMLPHMNDVMFVVCVFEI